MRAFPAAIGEAQRGAAGPEGTERDESGTIRRNRAGRPLGWWCALPRGRSGIASNDAPAVG